MQKQYNYGHLPVKKSHTGLKVIVLLLSILFICFSVGWWHTNSTLDTVKSHLDHQQRLTDVVATHVNQRTQVNDEQVFDKLQNKQIQLIQSVFTKAYTFSNTSNYNANREFVLGVCGQTIGNQLMPKSVDNTGHSQIKALNLKSYVRNVVCYPQQANQWLVKTSYYPYTDDNALLNLDALVPSVKWFVVTVQNGHIVQCQAQNDIRCVNN